MAPIAMLGSIGWPVVDRFRIGDSFAISPHGLFIAIGFMIGAWLFGRIAAARGVEERAISSIVLWSLIGAIVGARFFYVVAHWSEFAPKPVEALLIWKGGISLLGGIAGATIANAINIRRFGLRFFQVADALAAPLALGIAIGRIGDLIIGDHLGKPTSWLLAWRYSGGTVAPPFECLREFCQAPLQGDRLQTLERSGSQLLDRSRRGDRQRHRRASDGAVRHVARLGTVRAVVVVHEAVPPRGARGARCSRSTTAAAGCWRTSCGSTSASAR